MKEFPRFTSLKVLISAVLLMQNWGFTDGSPLDQFDQRAGRSTESQVTRPITSFTLPIIDPVLATEEEYGWNRRRGRRNGLINNLVSTVEKTVSNLGNTVTNVENTVTNLAANLLPTILGAPGSSDNLIPVQTNVPDFNVIFSTLGGGGHAEGSSYSSSVQSSYNSNNKGTPLYFGSAPPFNYGYGRPQEDFYPEMNYPRPRPNYYSQPWRYMYPSRPRYYYGYYGGEGRRQYAPVFPPRPSYSRRYFPRNRYNRKPSYKFSYSTKNPY